MKPYKEGCQGTTWLLLQSVARQGTELWTMSIMCFPVRIPSENIHNELHLITAQFRQMYFFYRLNLN